MIRDYEKPSGQTTSELIPNRELLGEFLGGFPKTKPQFKVSSVEVVI